MIDAHPDIVPPDGPPDALPEAPPTPASAPVASTAASATWSRDMTDALRDEADAARRLRELAERQGGFIAEGRLDTAQALVTHRGTLIEEIRGHQERVRTLAAVGADEGALEPAMAETIRDLQRSIRTDLQAVRDRDAEDRAAIIARRDVTQQELGRVSGGRKARQAYAGVATVAPRFGDERG